MIKPILQSNWGALLVALIITSPLTFWAFDRRAPVDVLEYRLSHDAARPGEMIYRLITVVRHKSCETDADVVLVDGAKTRWRIDEPPIYSPGPANVVDSYKQPMIIPVGAYPGLSEIRVTVTRRCNPMQRFWPLVSVYEPLHFIIKEP